MQSHRARRLGGTAAAVVGQLHSPKNKKPDTEQEATLHVVLFLDIGLVLAG